MFYPFVTISTPNTLVVMINKEDLFPELERINQHMAQGHAAKDAYGNPCGGALLKELLLSLHNAPKEMEEDFQEVLRKHDIPSMTDDPNLRRHLRAYQRY